MSLSPSARVAVSAFVQGTLHMKKIAGTYEEGRKVHSSLFRGEQMCSLQPLPSPRFSDGADGAGT